MKRLILTVLLGVFILGIKAQTISELFINIPDVYIPQLETEWRKDLVELYKTEKEARLENLMGGYSILQKMTDDYLLLHTTEKSTMEMKLLPLVNNTHIICLIRTVEGPVKDSHVEFYTVTWERLDAEELYTPVTREWFWKEDIDKTSNAYQDAIVSLNMDLVYYSLSPENNTLTATYTTPLYLSATERSKVEPLLKEEGRVYNWQRSRFN